MSRKHKATIRLAYPNVERLEQLQKHVHMPFTSIANSCIYEMLGDKFAPADLFGQAAGVIRTVLK